MKNTKKILSLVGLSLVLTSSVLTGCSENQKVQQNTELVTAAAESQVEESEKSMQEPEKYKDNFEVDANTAREFAEKIKEAVAHKDLEALADLTSFPVYVGLPDVGAVQTKEDFLAIGAENLFTDQLSASVEAADIEAFQPSRAGFSISDGGTANINFGVTDGILAVNGINY